MPEPTVFIVIDGPGWRPGGLKWHNHAFAEGSDKVIRVMGLDAFRAWTETELAPKPPER